MSWLGYAWVVIAVAWVVLASLWLMLALRKRQHRQQRTVVLTATAHEYSHSEWEALSNDEKEAAWNRYWGKQ